MAKIKNLDKLLTATDINKSIITLDELICELCNYGEEMNKLTAPQQLFHINQNLEREMNNGGFYQFFWNSSGEFAHETVVSLNTIGAVRTAALVQKAIDLFPGGKVPTDREEREDLLEQIQDEAGKVWNMLDQEFFKYTEDLNLLNMEYIRQHRDLF